MKPYYENHGVTIYNCDCEEYLAEAENDSVDVVVTSPPYNTLVCGIADTFYPEQAGGLNKWKQRVNAGYEDIFPSEDDYQKWVKRVVEKCIKVSSGLVWVNHKVRYRKGMAIHPLSFLDFPLFAEIIWDKQGAYNIGGGRYFNSHESIYGFGCRKFWCKHLDSAMSVWTFLRAKSKLNTHPCSFPVALVARLLVSSCPEGGIVLDPFFGSGSSAIAAIQNGMRCIGVEKEEKYCANAVELIEEYVSGKLNDVHNKRV